MWRTIMPEEVKTDPIYSGYVRGTGDVNQQAELSIMQISRNFPYMVISGLASISRVQ